jgi:hypothetical protein
MALGDEIAELKGEITELEGTIRQYETRLDACANDDLISKWLDMIKLKEESLKRKEDSLILLQQEARQLVTQQPLTSGGNFI